MDEIIKRNAELESLLAESLRENDRLRKSRDIYQSLIELMPQRLVRKDRDGRIVFANRAYLEELGLSLEEALGKDDKDLYPQHFVDVCEEGDSEVLDRGEIVDSEEEHWLRNEKRSIDVQVVKAPVFTEEGEISGVQAIFWDISNRKEAEREVVRLRNYLLSLIESMPSALIGIDARGRVSFCNKAALDLSAVPKDETEGSSFADIFPQYASETELIEKSLQSHDIQYNRNRKRVFQSELLYEDITVYPLFSNADEEAEAVIRIDNVTERVRLEEIVVQSDKMLSIGGLAAGIAHEVNNPLAGMIQSAGVIRKRLLDREIPRNREAAGESGVDLERLAEYLEKRDVIHLLDNMHQSGERVAEIIGNMLSFARKSDSSFTVQNPLDVIDSTLDLAASEYDLRKKYDFRKIKVEKEFESSIPSIYCDRSKIQQVLYNILSNAAHALADYGRQDPQIRISARLCHCGKNVLITIGDNGPGMSESIRKRIFEPFFTTKPEGIGTGLGLSVSYFIINEIHKGKLSVESIPDQGTVFRIKLPLKAAV